MDVRKKLGIGFVAGAAFLAMASPATAQVAWDSPFMVAAETPAGWGVYLVDPHPGSGIGVLTTFRGRRGPGTGYRIGLAEDRSGSLAVLGGVDVSGMLVRQSDDFPLDIVWVAGVGIGVGDHARVSAPAGLSIGRGLESDGVWFHPYLTPRVVMDARFGSGSNLKLDLAVDLGMDIAFDPGWTIRFGGTLGDREALAIGLSFRVF